MCYYYYMFDMYNNSDSDTNNISLLSLRLPGLVIAAEPFQSLYQILTASGEGSRSKEKLREGIALRELEFERIKCAA